MKSEKSHIGQSFDSFLKEENIKIKEDEIREQIENILKYRYFTKSNKKIFYKEQ